jgi:hypothetical protein
MRASAEPRPVEVVARPRAGGRLGGEARAVWDHANDAARGHVARVHVDKEVDDDAQAPQQVREVGESGQHLVELEVVGLGRALDVVVREVGTLAARPVVEAVGLEERVHRLLRGGRQARIGHVLEGHLAVRLVPLVQRLGTGKLLVEGARVRDPRRDRAEWQERCERPERVIEGRELCARRGRGAVGLLEKLQQWPDRHGVKVALRVVLKDVWAHSHLGREQQRPQLRVGLRLGLSIP